MARSRNLANLPNEIISEQGTVEVPVSAISGTLPVSKGGTGVQAVGAAGRSIRVKSTGDGYEFVEPITTSTNLDSFSGTLPVTKGGTGVTSLGTAGQFLRVNSGATGLEFGAPSVSVDDVTGTLPVSKGGTGVTSLGTAGQFLRVNSGGTALEFGAPSVSVDDVTGTLPVSKGGTGVTSLGTAGQLLRVNSGATGLEFATVSTGGGGSGGDEIGWTHFTTLTASSAGQQFHYLPNISGWNTTHTDMYIIVEYFQPSSTAGFYIDSQYSSSSGSSTSHRYMVNYDLRGSGTNFTAANGSVDGAIFKMSGWEIGTSTANGRGTPPCQGWIWVSNLHNSSTGASIKGHFVGTSDWGVPFEHSFGGMNYAGQNGAWQLSWLKPCARNSSGTIVNGSWKMNVYLRG